MSTSSNTPHANSTDATTERLMEFAGKVMGDVGSAFATLLAFIGDQTGVFAALRDIGRCDSATLAKTAKVDRALSARMVECDGRIRLCDLPRRR